jgi:hypothetical protein
LSRRLRDSRFVIASNGFAEGPAPALRDYLVEKRAGTVTTITHPLLPDDGSDHVVTRWQAGVQVGTRTVKLPSRPPWTYPLDLFVPPWPPTADAWFGFNATACLRGLIARRTGRARRVIYWCVDYVDERFGTGFLTQVYEWLDGVGCRSADARFELSMAAARARDRRHAGKPLVATRVVPWGPGRNGHRRRTAARGSAGASSTWGISFHARELGPWWMLSPGSRGAASR